MQKITLHNIPYEVHRAPCIPATHSGRSIEAEVRAILRDAVMPENRVKLGSLLAEIGKKVQLTEEELAIFERDRTPHEPLTFD